MNGTTDGVEYDAIVVGSGVAGATIARELSRRGRRVLVLERGPDLRPGNGLIAMATKLDAVPVGDGMAAAKADLVGGTTAFYFGVADAPALDAFRALGVELSAELAEATAELRIGPLPGALMGVRAANVRDAARGLGHDWKARDMFVDPGRTGGRYAPDARWSARAHLDEAIANGAILIDRAKALRAIVEGGRAVGVEYERTVGRGAPVRHRVHGARVVFAAGAAATPRLLRDSGLGDFGNAGFYCDPSFIVFGRIDRSGDIDNFGGAMGTDPDDGVMLGDANFCGTLHRVLMLVNRRPLQMFLRSRTIGVGVMVRDALGGGVDAEGNFRKTLAPEDHARLERGEAQAREIVRAAGGRDLFRSRNSAAHLGGMVRIGEHVDADLRAACEGLYVCDGSIVPQRAMGSPTLSLVCLGKYAAKRIERGW
ncbi:MAG: FAD-dependent oxidoreductase [Pseudomonadota bacterium]